MTFITRPFRLFGTLRGQRAEALNVPRSVTSLDMDPFVAGIARRVEAVPSDARMGRVAEMVRMSPYHAAPIVDAESGRFLGLATESSIARALLTASDAGERDRVRQSEIADAVEALEAFAHPGERARVISARMDSVSRDVLPVLDAEGRFLGLVGRSDLVQDLIRPFRPPTIGGMATPTGVYLTTGAVSGGATALSLIATGLLMFLVQRLPIVAIDPLSHWCVQAVGGGPVAVAVFGIVLPYIASLAIFLAAIRFSPISGYHAAEHQVVHAIERSEPLLVETVRAMPRVHPRCGTNLVAGVMICFGVGIPLSLLIGHFLPTSDLAETGYVLGGIVALAYWRTVGSFLQQYVTTRPATDAQIESGIRAAREVLARHSAAPDAPIRPHARLWRMGMLPMVGGLVLGYALLMLAARVFPSAAAYIQPLL
jgi:CBS domain-containing protein